MKLNLLFPFCCMVNICHAQNQNTDTLDNSRLLKEITISAYGLERPANEAPASINVIAKSDIDRHAYSILQSLNATPGMRMEERSPGSFRMSIRGSSLRSPFGVRNVKIYYNGIPVTDPGGFTYFNQFSFENIESMQIIKGPSGSIYGAGNGGVMLLNSIPEHAGNKINVGTVFGSYGLNRTFATIERGDSNRQHVLRYEHLQTDGYRQQSAMRKEMLAYHNKIKAGKRTELGVNLLFNDLEYQTPGALTLTEFTKNANSARPDAGMSPGAVTQNARIFQRNVLAGFSLKSDINAHWKNETNLYAFYGQMENAAIRNYSKTKDPHFGGRSSFHYTRPLKTGLLHLIFGTEAQKSIANTNTYSNKRGNKDTLQSADKIESSNVLGFAQLSWQAKRLTLETGLGASQYSVNIRRSFPGNYSLQTRSVQVSPRFAIAYKAAAHASVYINIARGYSTPTSAELAPSGSAINTALKPEFGWNYEAGTRGNFYSNKLSYDFSFFYYELSNAIVLRKDSLGGDNYINAGGTKQAGIEAKLDYRMIENKHSFFSLAKINAAYTGYHFRYHNFIQATENFTGKLLPGTAEHTLALGFDLQIKNVLTINTSCYTSGRIALNDANTAFAAPYQLLNCRLAYTISRKKFSGELFAGADNLFNQNYSLGNDINAAGGRYYNAAMPRNYYAGIKLGMHP